ncbi:heat shock protein DnaJ domain protein [Gloeothece citriformis PCC 7424]|uniref:Heat shock protein DnaJ domain protein n=1 Tax=Gloeothece citriformis (strain PCC 7424) TaxID=65393 RepID=B7KDF4_GLOC7|nr:J domain-containing protein [Gloeothece citriformis]ACK68974.1 heat shock protein DnaJ domain protein [Gloeothece citriformis PCC 7424]
MAFPIQQGLFQYIDLDHYAILGVPIGAELKEIRLRYLNVARRLHPDTCKALTKAEKERANTLLSKLVNPAWEHLSREGSRLEYSLILSQIGQRLAHNEQQFSFKTKAAQQLIKSQKNVELEYKNLVQSLAGDQYASVDSIYQKIAQLSELNLAYLIVSQSKSSRPTLSNPPLSLEYSRTLNTDTIFEQPPQEEELPKESPVISYIRRAQSYADKGNYAQVVLEMRDALKLEPNNSTCHGLLGLAYLRQNQASMAKIHITTALKHDPNNEIALDAKRELDKVITANDQQTKPGDSSKQSKSFWTLFGGRDKKK